MRYQVDSLRDAIREIDRLGQPGWLSGLEERKLAELAFHNRDRDEAYKSRIDGDTFDKFYGNKKYYKTTTRSRLFIQEWIRQNAKDKIFLDYACGNGDHALQAAKAGALLALGFDISDVSVRNCQMAAAERGLNASTCFFQADAEDSRLPAESIDSIICSGMLHHLDLSYAFPEMRRILRPGGRVLAVEALDYNPAIKLYRALTPEMRTEWEKAHILSLRDIAFAKRFFDVENIRFWHVLGYAGAIFPFAAQAFDAMDRILERVPLVRLLAWSFTFELVKR